MFLETMLDVTTKYYFMVRGDGFLIIESLKKIREYKMVTALPAHGSSKGINVYQQIVTLEHHKAKLRIRKRL